MTTTEDLERLGLTVEPDDAITFARRNIIRFLDTCLEPLARAYLARLLEKRGAR